MPDATQKPAELPDNSGRALKPTEKAVRARNYGDRREDGSPYDLGQAVNHEFMAAWHMLKLARKDRDKALAEVLEVGPENEWGVEAIKLGTLERIKWESRHSHYRYMRSRVAHWQDVCRLLRDIRLAGKAFDRPGIVIRLVTQP